MFCLRWKEGSKIHSVIGDATAIFNLWSQLYSKVIDCRNINTGEIVEQHPDLAKLAGIS